MNDKKCAVAAIGERHLLRQRETAFFILIDIYAAMQPSSKRESPFLGKFYLRNFGDRTMTVASPAASDDRYWLNVARYEEMYAESISDPDKFWGEHGKRLAWIRPYTKVKNTSFEGDVDIRWFEDGTLNASVNCIDRHLPQKSLQTALIWEGDGPSERRCVSYIEMYDAVCRLGNVLRKKGIKKGDRVVIYMPMIPEAIFAMLACARIGAIHSVVFAGFSSASLADRIMDCEAKLVITADAGMRGGRKIQLKHSVDKALLSCPCVETVIVVRRTSGSLPWKKRRDYWYHEECAQVSAVCSPEEMNAEDPLFILYTSGSTGKPKGILHTTGGYLLYAAMTHEYVLDYHDGDIYWCAADIGWITGHSYVVYGPLANGATTLLFEGIPTYPNASRYWQIIDRHKVNIFYTSPTAIRSLIREGDDAVKQTSRASLKLLATVGEPINPDVWRWYYRVVGDGRCPVIDTWWQTETGGHMITPIPGVTKLIPGSVTKPFFGVKPVILDARGKVMEGAGEGSLCIADSWPGQARTLYGDHERFRQIYFTSFKGYYFSGDGCRRDDDGNYWITGRIDDVINVSGHRLGTAEIESAIVALAEVAEAAVVGYPHDVKGQGIYAFVTLKMEARASESLRKSMIHKVRNEIGPIATPDIIHWVSRLPKTRSGKIMRRILRKIAANDIENFGDISTLAEPDVVQELILCGRAT